MRRSLALLSVVALAFPLAACSSGESGSGAADSELSAVIAQAQGLSSQELYKKAIEESKGKTMYGIGNSSRGSTAAESFIAELQKIDPSYDGKIEWSQPKNNSIFQALSADINSAKHTYSMTLIQDGNQIQSKMLATGNLLNFIPKDWGGDQAKDGNPLTLQTIGKVFMVNNLGSKKYTNVWDFVAEGEKPMFMGVNSEPVGKNFLYMLTSPKYADELKAAFDKLPADQQAYFQKTVDEVAPDVETLGLEGDNAKYGLAWAKLWAAQYNEKTDDGPICNDLVTKSAAGSTALIVYSKLRSIEESDSASVKNVDIAAYQDDYTGFGGYGYKHYLMLTKTSPLPWTAMAFINYMSTTQDGFAAWGKDIGGYGAYSAINQDHSNDGGDEFPAKNDKGPSWWLDDSAGRLVIEDPVYTSKVSTTMGDWIDMIVGQKS
ncbi:MAG: hypothetical protein LBR21_09085 [Propionibacteriaceae bacterium]|jgi:hypothetical protein|nr:hypothetical protein [Propionibacteriaceae bacterium]